MGNKLFSKTDEFSKGALCDRQQFFRVPYFFEGPVPNLALLQCHESDNQRASCVSCRVVNVVCLCAKQKHKHSTVSRRKRYQMGRPYKPYIKYIGLYSKYYCFQSRIVLLKAFSLYICFQKIITFFLIRVSKNEKKKDLTRHFCQKFGRVGRVTLNTGKFFLALNKYRFLSYLITFICTKRASGKIFRSTGTWQNP